MRSIRTTLVHNLKRPRRSQKARNYCIYIIPPAQKNWLAPRKSFNECPHHLCVVLCISHAFLPDSHTPGSSSFPALTFACVSHSINTHLLFFLWVFLIFYSPSLSTSAFLLNLLTPNLATMISFSRPTPTHSIFSTQSIPYLAPYPGKQNPFFYFFLL